MDPYIVLGIAPDASKSTVKHAYRQLARDLHPDRNPNSDSATRFGEVHDAYELACAKIDNEYHQALSDINVGFNEAQAVMQQRLAKSRTHRSRRRASRSFKAYKRQLVRNRAELESTFEERRRNLQAELFAAYEQVGDEGLGQVVDIMM